MTNYFCNDYPFQMEIDDRHLFFSWYVSTGVFVTVDVCTEMCAQKLKVDQIDNDFSHR